MVKRSSAVLLFSNYNNDDTVLKIGDDLLAEFSKGAIPAPADTKN